MAISVALCCALFAEGKAHAASPTDDDDRTEWAGFPILGGSTDIGIQLGAAGAFTHLSKRFTPYWWKVDGLLSLSVKGGPRGTEVVQQSHDMRWDIPGGAAGKLRLMPGIFYDKTINSGYFGFGNASKAITNAQGQLGDRYQFQHEEASARLNVRSPLGDAWSAMYGWQIRYVNPHAYPGSQLAIDAATRLSDGRPVVYGLQPLGIATLNGGVVYDSRDSETFPAKGQFHVGALRVSGATPTASGVHWAGLTLVLRSYARLFSGFSFAGRIIIDAMAGTVPFYDLSQGGAFDPNDMPGGALSVRGVPNGRYAGLLKVVGNAEIRRIHGEVRLLGTKFQIGTTAFFDTGRVWNDYTFSDPKDGKGIGLKYGVGGGPFLVWGSAATFRVDVAYSPDASAANPGFPLGIYVEDGVMF